MSNTPGFGGNFRITEFQAAILNGQLRRLRNQLDYKNQSIAYLQREFAQIPGVEVLARDNRMTSFGMYRLSLTYDVKEFQGVSRDVFVDALNAEGIPGRTPYPLVHECNLYTSGPAFLNHGARVDLEARYNLKAKTPVADKIVKKVGWTFPHEFLLAEPKVIENAVLAVRKIRSQIRDLKLASLKTQTKSFIKKALGIHRQS